MNLYHNSKKDDYPKIITSQKFKINKRFSYPKYVDYLIDCVNLHKASGFLPGNYPGSYVQAPFMGHGIYCFISKKDAERYQSNGKVLKLDVTDNIDYLDLDDEDVLFGISDMLKECKEKIESTIKDEELKRDYLLLVEIITACLYEEFENSQPAVGIILYWHNALLENAMPDLIKRTFSQSSYYLLTNKNKILSIS